MNVNAARMEADRKAKHERDFHEFLDKAETKMLMALVPQLEPPELLRTLLRGAFEAGAGAGMGHVIGIVLEGMLKAPRDRGE